MHCTCTAQRLYMSSFEAGKIRHAVYIKRCASGRI
jgi:hypothetical protein